MYLDYLNHSCIRDCSNSAPRQCVYDWTIELYATMSRACYNCPRVLSDCARENCVAANGVPRSIEVVNRQMPGPSIQVCEGDEVLVNVRNFMRSHRALSIHWHGMLQKGTPHMDGV